MRGEKENNSQPRSQRFHIKDTGYMYVYVFVCLYVIVLERSLQT